MYNQRIWLFLNTASVHWQWIINLMNTTAEHFYAGLFLLMLHERSFFHLEYLSDSVETLQLSPLPAQIQH